jgi:hypothetical protein
VVASKGTLASIPCFNTGHNSCLTASNDRDGNTRMAGDNVDMGAREWWNPVISNGRDQDSGSGCLVSLQRTAVKVRYHMIIRLALGSLALALALTSSAAELRLSLPLRRTVYQCNEWLDLAVFRFSPQALPAGELHLILAGDDASRLEFTFPAHPATPEGSLARSVEHLRINVAALRPGSYTLSVTCDGVTAATNIAVYSHIRHSDFKLINWGRARGRDQLAQGEESLGFNLFYGQYGADEEANFIRAGVDFMANCVMSGGHQMDLRTECDWSDPYVIRGGTRRVVRRAFLDRTRPNVWGIHFYDEPGLTWVKDAETGESTAHAVPWQARSFAAAFGEPPLDWKRVNGADPDQAARWKTWVHWKLGIMDAAWKDAQDGVSRVKPGYVSVTQSQYGYSAFSDGYYFNVVRSLPIISGHGGYHDFGPGYFNPSMFLEFARARDLTKPNWYLPTWYGNTTADQFRLEQYLSFQCNLQGMISPPDLEPGGAPEKSAGAQGIVESNHLLARLGPIFNTLPVTRPPVAILFSLSQMLHAQTLDRKVCYAHDTPHGRNVVFAYLAGKLLQHQFMPLLDEEVTDGTLAAGHRAVVLVSVDYLDAPVITGLVDFARAGGLVLLTADSSVKVNGAVRLDLAPAWLDAARIAELKATGRNNEAGDLMRLRQALAGARRLADALQPHLDRAGLQPPLRSSEPGIVITRQASGDVEYLLAVNAAHDPEGHPMLGIKPVNAVLELADDSRPVYDAVHGGLASQYVSQGGRRRGQFRFGPGQMRVFARTARGVGGVTLATPVVQRDHLRADAPLRLDLEVAVLDQRHGLLAGSVPLDIGVQDSFGATRYRLYRATDRGLLKLSLPLALNDPPGQWGVTVTELLSHSNDSKEFSLEATRTCSAAAGAVWRAVHWPEDRDHVFRFFRTHSQLTLVPGTNDFNRVAAERLAHILEPWNITCTVVPASQVNRPRPLTEDEARTWIGLDFAGRGQIKAGASNSPVQAGFAQRGPVVLLGTPQDNPLIKFLGDQRFLPYPPEAASMPGPRRGYLAWQREALGVNQESIALIALIACDAEGMSEAVGTLYEMAAGLEPLTPLAQPSANRIAPASRIPVTPALTPDWETVLPDRITGLTAEADRLLVLSHDGSLNTVSSGGAIISQLELDAVSYTRLSAQLRPVNAPDALATARRSAPADRLVKLAATQDRLVAVAYWGGRVNVFDPSGLLKATTQRSQDVTAMIWVGSRLITGDADGRLAALTIKE